MIKVKNMQENDENSSVSLIPYYPNYETALAWYQDLQLCKQVDNIDYVYSLERLKAMYHYLDTHGECYYIQYGGILVGDVTLQDSCLLYTSDAADD